MFLTKHWLERPAEQEPSGWRRFFRGLQTALPGHGPARSPSTPRECYASEYVWGQRGCPAICCVTAAFKTEEGVVLVSEYAEGNSLRELLATGPLTMADAGWIFPIIAEAVDSAGPPWPVPSPGNVIITADDRVRLIGYDILHLPGLDVLAEGGATHVAAFYQAPEQLTRGATIPASNQYSVAVMLIEALTGSRPPREETSILRVRQVSVIDPSYAFDPGPDVFEHPSIAPTAAAFRRALSRSTRRRFGTCQEFVTAALTRDKSRRRGQ